MGKTKLDKREARSDLTSRECAKILGGTIGSLCEMADLDAIKAAISWWAERPEAVGALYWSLDRGNSRGEDRDD